MSELVELGEVHLLFMVTITGKVSVREMDRRIEDATRQLREFEQEFNKGNALKLYVSAGAPV